MRHRFTSAAAAAATTLSLLLAAGSAGAGTVLVDGQFTQDDALFSFGFDLVQDDVFTATTFSYGGSAAHGIAPGGFAPVLALFQDGFGLLQLAVGSTNTCGSGSGSPDPVSTFCWDAQLTLTGAAAGHYTLVLSQDGNLPLGVDLADGYSQTLLAAHDYTSIYNGQPGSTFIDVTGLPRTGHWAMELSAPNSPAVPEPGSALLLVAGLALLPAARRIAGR